MNDAQRGIGSRQILERSVPVWVDLERLYRGSAPVDGADVLPALRDDLDLGAEVAGMLHEWTRSGRGMWLGVVSFEVPYRRRRGEYHRAERQLVPSDAIRPQKQRPCG